MIIDFPDIAEVALKRLQELHPGKSINTILARAMCFYHACYELHLEGRTGEEINMIMEHLDKQDDERENEET